MSLVRHLRHLRCLRVYMKLTQGLRQIKSMVRAKVYTDHSSYLYFDTIFMLWRENEPAFVTLEPVLDDHLINSLRQRPHDRILLHKQAI